MSRKQQYRPCTACGWPDGQPAQIASRHVVMGGVLVYARCACGRLRVWLEPTDEGASQVFIDGKGQSSPESFARLVPDERSRERSS